MNKPKVLIVDDSAFMRKLITDFIHEDGRMEVVGTARDGKDAVKKAIQLKPHVITMDVEMPILNGIEAVREILDHNPIPIVMLSSTTTEGAENTILAMEMGAIDFIAKPSGAISLDLHKIKDEIILKVFQASKANLTGLKKHKKPGTSSISLQEEYSTIIKETKPKLSTTSPNHQQKLTAKKILCIGTSTGGPRALQSVLTALPADINAPVLIVQHMPAGFTKSLANRLDSLCAIRVKEAENGEKLEKGTAYIAPGGFHMKVKKSGNTLTLKTDQTPIRNGHRPSVDVMLESVCDLVDYRVVTVIMTGMGSDGTDGLIKLKSSVKNVFAIAESENTSVVFGMPKTAIATKLVDDIEDLDKIASAITKNI